MDPTQAQDSATEIKETTMDGNSLIDAIMNKYGDMESGLHDMGDVQVYFSAPAKKATQENNDNSNEKSALKLPSIVVLNRCRISKAGDKERIAALCGPVQELDLAENCLQCWSEIGTITKEIPNLEFLNLSSNPLYKAPTPEGTLITMATVRRLVLNNTKMPWETVHSILQATPSLNELHLSLNEFSTVAQSQERHPNVKLLQFNNNQITSWQEVQKLGWMFPDLETLILMQNQIQTLENCAPSDIFPHLRMLCLSETLLDSWEELDKLNDFPSLTEVLVQGIPLLQALAGAMPGTGPGTEAEVGAGARTDARAVEEEKKKIRQLVIARLGKLKRLNRSRITENERETAERMFIRKFKDNAEKPPRYEELVRKHGHMQDLANVDLSTRNIVQCEVLYDDQLLDDLIEVNVKHTVQQLRKQLAQLVKLPPSKFRIYAMEADTNRDKQLCTELSLPRRFLHNYRITDGACFYIVPKS